MEIDRTRPYGRYRVIELPGAVPMQFGKSFADLGADVIKVEPPGGDPSRSLPPFAAANGLRFSLYWAAYGQGKRSITLDVESKHGRSLLAQLAAVADVVVDAYAPGYLDALGVGYGQLSAINPQLVLSAISPFGQTGPFSDRRGSDLVQFAMGGYLYMTGLPDDAPIKPSAPYQTWFHGCMQAVAATLLALRRRRQTGRGALVDEAMRETSSWMLTHTYQFWDMLGVNLKRQGASRDMGGVLRLPAIWRTRDGYIVWQFQTGHIGGRYVQMLVEWMAEEGMAPDWMREADWVTFDLLSAGQETAGRLSAIFADFFATKSKAELYTWALPRGVMLAPIQNLGEVLTDEQLAAREAWRTLALAGTSLSARVPGPPVRLSGAGWEPRGPAPRLGEHNAAVLGELLGLDLE